MYLSIILSLLFHACLLNDLKFKPITSKNFRNIKKSENIKITVQEVTKTKSKGHQIKETNKIKSKPKQVLSNNYQSLLKSSRNFLISQSVSSKVDKNTPDRDGFYREWGQVGGGVKFGKDLYLNILAPLFLMQLDGYERAEVILNKCRSHNKWVVGKLSGHDYLRAYLYEKIVVATLFEKNSDFLTKAPYRQIKITLLHIRTMWPPVERVQHTFTGNHFFSKYIHKIKCIVTNFTVDS